ncbi:hypothetical protein FJZ26_05005 [Candidatus Parvarchaeota archaeon]|nr:hypothetical protein [Candidatus Parvarchaeota archaeon]
MKLSVIDKILIMFIATQLLGVYVGSQLVENAKIIPEFKEFSVSPVKGNPDSILNSVIMIGYILAGAGIMLLVIKYYKGAMLFNLIEFAVIFSASNIVFFVLLFKAWQAGAGQALSADLLILFTLGISFGFAALKFLRPKTKNLAAVVSSAGVGAIFGFSIGFYPTLLLILLLSAYDYLAVFKTKHMVTMARELDVRQMSFAVSAREVKKVMQERMVGKKKIVEEVEQEGARLDLGTGDLSIPAMLSVSAYAFGGAAVALASVIGSSIAIYVLLKFVSERRVFLPALPPICLGGVAAILVARFAGL